MAAKKCGAPPRRSDGSWKRPDCVAAVRAQTRERNQHYADSAARRARVLSITAWLAVVVGASFTLMQIVTGSWSWQILSINVCAVMIFAMVPWLKRFGELVAPLTFIGATYVSVFASCWDVGTGSGSQFFLLVGACLVVLLLGIEHIVLAASLAAVAAALVIALQFLVPRDTGLQPAWAQSMGFVITTISACVMVVVTVWFALRDTERAEAMMEVGVRAVRGPAGQHVAGQHRRAAQRVRPRNVIADKYDEASVLFADIVGFTERASSTTPADLVRFLDRLYGAFDELVDKHGLEKIKVSGDSYMVVSGVPRPRPDHVQALADFALEMADVAAGLKDPHGHSVPLRVGMATRPGRRGCRGFSPVLLRRMGRRGQRRVPDGIHRLGGTHSSARGDVPAPQGRVRAAGARPHRGQGKRHHAHVVPLGRKAADRDPAICVAEESRTAHVLSQNALYPDGRLCQTAAMQTTPGTAPVPSLLPHLWKSTLVSGILSLILGVVVIAWPGISILVAAIAFGVYLLVTGIAQVIFAFSLHVSAGSRILLFISGAASLILAVLAFRHFGTSGYAILLLAIWIGIGFIFRGVATTISAISDPNLPGRGWSIFVGVISLLAGIVVLASPFESIVTLAIVVGVWFVVIGVFEIVSSFGIRKASSKARRVGPDAVSASPTRLLHFVVAGRVGPRAFGR